MWTELTNIKYMKWELHGASKEVGDKDNPVYKPDGQDNA